MRAKPKLSRDAVAKIKGMLARGDRQADIALWFSVSAATVNAIKFGRVPAYRAVEPCRSDELPERGPYVIVPKSVHDATLSARIARDLLVSELTALLRKYDDTQKGPPSTGAL